MLMTDLEYSQARRCEDYPCCGHADGECGDTRTADDIMRQAYKRERRMWEDDYYYDAP